MLINTNRGLGGWYLLFGIEQDSQQTFLTYCDHSWLFSWLFWSHFFSDLPEGRLLMSQGKKSCWCISCIIWGLGQMNIDLVFMFYQLLHIVISQRISPSYDKKKCTSAATMHFITLTISLQWCIKLSYCHRLFKSF